jgi:WD40 repeat protein
MSFCFAKSNPLPQNLFMSRIFLSHSSKNNDSAVALRDWLAGQGWDDVFLDLDPNRGIAAGDRWERALNQAALRCEAVLFLVSRAWLTSDWCLKEFNLAHRLNKRLFGLLIEDIAVGELPATLTGTWQLVPLASGRDHIMLRAVLPGTHDEVHVTFSREGLTRLRIGLERAGLDAKFFAWPPRDDPKRPPYRGLLPLEAADAGIFFGREALTIEALDRIRGIKDGAAPRLLVLLGASGAGKSSFLRAGLLPRLGRDDRNYLTLPVIRPERAAINGEAGLLRSLEVALSAPDMIMPRAEIRGAIEGGATTLRPLLQTVIDHARIALVAEVGAKAPVLVLAIDQGEELFLTDGASESGVLLNLLRELLAEDAPALLVVVTIRSDAYEQLQIAKALEGITQQTLSLIPMPRGAYQAVIEGPAVRLNGTDRRLVIEPALTQALLSDIEEGRGRDALPLLAFTLERLYLEYGARGRLTLRDYDALGRIRGSIEAAVERAFAAADADARIPRDRDARLALLRRGLIPWLAGIDPDTGNPRRQKARISEIPEEARPLIDLLVEQRLLSTDVAADTGERTIEPAHESLLRQWGSLQGWLKEDFAALTNLETVKRAARDWAANAKSEDWLAHRAGRLEEAERLLERADFAGKLGATDRAYLAVCREREEIERKEKAAALERRLRLQRRFSIAAAFTAVVMAVVGGLAWQKWDEAEKQKIMARTTQARLLSSIASQLTDAGDPTSAMLLALAALPDKTTKIDLPQTVEAESVLRAASQSRREIAVLAGHAGPLRSASFSADGRRVLTASDDGTAIVWDSKIRKPTVFLRGHTDILRSAVFSPDSRHVLTASDDKTARLWDADTGELISVPLVGHTDRIMSAIFSPDGQRIVTVSRDKTARLWNSETGREIAVMVGHEGSVLCVAFSRDGRRIATGSADQTARIWDAANGQPIVVLHGHSNWVMQGGVQLFGEVRSVEFSPDGRRLLTASLDNTARLWDTQTGQTLFVLKHGWAVASAAFSPNGQRIVTASWDKTARIWDSESGAQLNVLKGHEDVVVGAAFNYDGKYVITASSDKTVRVWETETGATFAVLRGHENEIVAAGLSPDGTLIVTASTDKTARLWSINQITESLVFKNRYPLNSATFSPDGKRIVAASYRDTSHTEVWDLENRRIVEVEISGGTAAFSPDGRYILGPSRGSSATIWDAQTGEPIVIFKGHESEVFAAAFSRDGRRVITGSNDGTARIWDAETGRSIGILSGHEEPVRSVAFSPNGKRLVTTSLDHTARVWDADNFRTLAVLSGHEDYIGSAAFSPDGKLVVTASEDGTARIWNADTGAQIASLQHKAQVHTAVFSPDGRWLLTANGDATARLWDAHQLVQIAIFRGHGHTVNSASFSLDGSQFVTASDDLTARVWNVYPKLPDLIAHAIEVVPRCLTSEQREKSFLDAGPPAWCVYKGKWPYETPTWKTWLANSGPNGQQ